MSTPVIPFANPDAAPAHALWVQLATRITTQPLHYRSGEEEAAVWSVFLLFDKTRQLLEAHPQATRFREIAVPLLNVTLRPYTARWHGWLTQDKERKDKDGKPLDRFRDEQVRRQFRAELEVVQKDLRDARRKFACLAGFPDVEAEYCLPKAELGAALPVGITPGQVPITEPKPTQPTAPPVPATLAKVEEINRVEQERILNRRKQLETPCGPKNSPTAAHETEVLDATGLALSGGGIRSATFCLGIVQVLVRKGLFPQFDYLSTVSGGGYLGAFLSCALGGRPPETPNATLQEAADARLKDVFMSRLGQPTAADGTPAAPQSDSAAKNEVESGLLRHLRNHSKYLLGGGLLGRLTVGGLLISGLLWNVMMVLPFPLGAALLAALLGPALWGKAVTYCGPVLPDLGSPAGVIFLAWAGLLGLAWLALPAVQLAAHGKEPSSRPALLRSWWEYLSVLIGAGTVVFGIVYALPAVFHGYEWLRHYFAGATASHFQWKQLLEYGPALATAGGGAAVAALAGWLGPRWPRIWSVAIKLFILSGPVAFLLVFLLVGNRLGVAREGGATWPWWAVLIVVVALAIWAWFFVNINTVGPHRYYRGRLCDCYLVERLPDDAPRPPRSLQFLTGESVQGSVQIRKLVPLTSLNAHPAAPYHLINMTLNVPASDNKNLRGRGGDFFLASREFYGSPLTGYARSADLAEADPHFDLGTAMAVSGAAASTNMGWQSLPHFRFLMALFNVRLGYWLRRPGVEQFPWAFEGAGPWYFFHDMLGWLTEKSRYVNLSDGGHIENLAAYELLRRRCKFIVCVDAGHEPGMECGDLMRLQRYAEIDLGLRMHFDVGDLQIGQNGCSRAHAILVKIDYAPPSRAVAAAGGGAAGEVGPKESQPEDPRTTSDQLGWMLYLKLAVTGVEPNHVHDYRRQEREFPHQSTGDQIYEEEQFEAYRALGECAMKGFFRSEIVGEQSPASLRDWFQCLANKLLPDNDPAFCSNSSAPQPPTKPQQP